MNTEYDFIQLVNSSQLLDEINTAGLPTPTYINTQGTSVAIFYSTPLTDNQLSILTTVVTNHVANFAYVTLAAQAQIATIIGYLNNSNVSVANTARAVIIATMAPQIPLATLTAINSQIATLLSQ